MRSSMTQCDTNLIQRFVGSSYDVLKSVASQLSEIHAIFEILGDVPVGVQTFDELRDYNRPQGVMALRVAGGNAAFDGQGGYFVYDDQDTSSVDTAPLVIVGADGTRWKRLDLGSVGGLAFTRDDFVAWRVNHIPKNGALYYVNGLTYQGKTGATDIADLPDLVPLKPLVSPRHFGAMAGISDDYGDEINAAATFVRSSWNSTKKRYDYVLDFGGDTFRSDSSINLTGKRQNGLKIQNGTLYSKAAGKAAIDLVGSYRVQIRDFQVYGAEDAPPAYGFLVGRALINGSYLASPFHFFSGTTGTDGWFTHAGYCNMASEGNIVEASTSWSNSHPSEDAFAVIIVGDNQSIDDYCGSLVGSDYQTVKTSGSASCLSHKWQGCRVKRPALYNLAIQSVSLTNPVTITVAAGKVAEAGLVNGQKVFIVKGLAESMGGEVYTIANVVGDTFQLVGVDGSAWEEYDDSGYVNNVTGPAMLISGVNKFNFENGYMLTYGNPAMVIDTRYGQSMRIWDVSFQHERDAPSQVRFVAPDTGQATMTDINITLLNASQLTRRQHFRINSGLANDGDGTLRLAHSHLSVLSGPSEVPINGMIYPPSKLEGYDLHLWHRSAAQLPDVSECIAFSGSISAANLSPPTRRYGEGHYDVRLSNVQFDGNYRDHFTAAGAPMTTNEDSDIISGGMMEMIEFDDGHYERNAAGILQISGKVELVYVQPWLMQGTLTFPVPFASAAKLCPVVSLREADTDVTPDLGDVRLSPGAATTTEVIVNLRRQTGATNFDPADTAQAHVQISGRWRALATESAPGNGVETGNINDPDSGELEE